MKNKTIEKQATKESEEELEMEHFWEYTKLLMDTNVETKEN